MLGNFMSLFSSADFFSRELLSKISFRNMNRVSNSMDPDNLLHFSLIWVQAVCKVYQRKSFSRQIVVVVGK